MSNGWEEKTVIHLQQEGCLLVEDGNHGAYRPKQNEFGSGDWAFIRAADMEDGQILFETAARINQEARDRIVKGIGKGGDVLLSHKGTVGKLALAPLDSPLFVCSPQTTFWRCLELERLDRRYLYYFMLSNDFRDQLDARKGETDMADYVSLTAQRDLKVIIPPIEVQHSVARILGALDDKIRVNHRMNDTLASMAQTLFKSWFVDFDPVVAKSEGRQPYGMNAETATLFPSAFQDSELGAIPAGWSISMVDNIATVIDCLHAKKPTQQESGKIFLQLNNIRDDGLIDLSEIYYISDDDYNKWISRLEAREGDCVITNVGRVGAVAQIPPGLYASLGRNMTAIRCKEDFPFPAFLITCLMSDVMREEISTKIDTGTILDALNVKNIPLLRFILASKPALSAFEKIVRPLRARMETNLENSRALASIRNALLPKLLSGEIRVKVT